jgi:hypothetical protein
MRTSSAPVVGLCIPHRTRVGVSGAKAPGLTGAWPAGSQQREELRQLEQQQQQQHWDAFHPMEQPALEQPAEQPRPELLGGGAVPTDESCPQTLPFQVRTGAVGLRGLCQWQPKALHPVLYHVLLRSQRSYCKSC